jgi:hypothetical protein
MPEVCLQGPGVRPLVGESVAGRLKSAQQCQDRFTVSARNVAFPAGALAVERAILRTDFALFAFQS